MGGGCVLVWRAAWVRKVCSVMRWQPGCEVWLHVGVGHWCVHGALPAKLGNLSSTILGA